MKPNIILIVSDQHRRDWVGCSGEAGARCVRTPHIDALAARGVLFPAAYCAHPLCGPSRMAMLTGRRSSRLGMYVNEQTLRSDIPTFAHALGRAGYESVLCGRMHFQGIDQRHGFERRLVGDTNSTTAGIPDRKRDAERWEGGDSPRAATVGRGGRVYHHAFDLAVTRAAEDYLGARSREERPLLLTIGFLQPHHPFVAPEAAFETALRRMKDLDDRPAEAPHPHPNLAEMRGRTDAPRPTPEQTRRARAAYAGMIDTLDEMVGRVLTAARQSLHGPTLVIYTSDHGEMGGDRGLWGKQVFYEAAAGVPLIIGPLREKADDAGVDIDPGRICRTPVSHLDIAPFLASVTGAPALPGIDGHDFTPLLHAPADGEREPGHPPAFSETCCRFPALDGSARMAIDEPPVAMLRSGDWKLVYYHPAGRAWTQSCTLHNLREDPDERCDRADDPACAGIRTKLIDHLLTGWNPESVSRDATARALDLSYLAGWGRSGGERLRPLGLTECWDPRHKPLDYGVVAGRENVR